MPRRGDRRPFNSFVFAGPDGTTHRYRKIHSFTYGGEPKHFRAGDELTTFTIAGARVTPLVCYDLRFADEFWQRAAATDVFVVTANWPAPRRLHWQTLLQARAIENLAYVVGCNRVGTGGGLDYAGDSRIVDPLGELLTTAAGDETTLFGDDRPRSGHRRAGPFRIPRRPSLIIDAARPPMLPAVKPGAYEAADDRYDTMAYRRCGRSGLQLPALSLGLWHNFGHDRPYDTQRAIVRRAFDRGVTHFDLANNYGPPYGSAEVNFGRMLADDLAPYRDELVISTKAGYDMWPGPYGQWGSRKYLLASLDQSLQRMGLDYVDIFYSHRLDPDTPLEETMGALDTAVRSGRALYAGISSYNSARTREAAAILGDLGTPLLIHQPSYSMINRWIEDDGLLDTLEEVGAGCIAFSPLAQGLLTNRYLDGVPADSRVATGGAMGRDMLTEDRLGRVRALNDVATSRGQTLAQLALAWALRDPRMTSLVIGASSVAQLDDNVGALDRLDLTDDELGRDRPPGDGRRRQPLGPFELRLTSTLG